MRMVAIVGPSETGKTNLIVSLIQQLHQQGLKGAVLKIAQEQIELDQRGKDSWRFQEAGAFKVGVLSQEKLFFIRNLRDQESWFKIILDYFIDVDFLLIEGGKKEPAIKKILVARESGDLKLVEPAESLLAIVSEEKLSSSLPHFYPYQVKELASFLLDNLPAIEPLVYLKVNEKNIPLNPFVESMIKELVQAMIKPLKNIPESPELISITLRK